MSDRQTASDTLLEIRDLTRSFGPVQALRHMNLDIRPGKVHTLLGENGAGKSTLIKILSGLFPPSSGSIRFKGKAYSPASPLEATELGITTIFQELSLSRNLTVAENIYANHEPNSFGFIREKTLYDNARQLIAELDLPIDVLARVDDLSMAQRQLVEIAKGLSRPADLVIMDEPTSSLSDSEAELLFAIIEKLKARGTAIIYISHRMSEIMRISDDITIMRDGEYITTLGKEEADINKLIALMVGRSLDNVFPPRISETPTPNVTPLLEVDQLTAHGFFEDISFKVRPGEILGFFGLVGSGRSDVMKALFGLVPYTGNITIDGKAVTIRNPGEAIKLGLAFVTENRKEEGLVLSHSVGNNISMVALGYFTNSLGFLKTGLERNSALEQVRRLAIKTPNLEFTSGNLSGGNQQKIVLAKWLENKPRILILDEPTRGVDVGAKFEIYTIIRELAAQGTAILLVSSELPEVLGLSDRVIVMHKKQISADLPAENLTQEYVMTHAAGVAHAEGNSQ
ncbi:sugar ABC transporter ATP-binding protein [Microvirga sp. W0021]|uniref:Sugar ABC transporter ATP-binding protein n=1 Tax=Hohaiivirga grylli TaxID=3133970 RepID=A0ABV0BH67_9HYPH